MILGDAFLCVMQSSYEKLFQLKIVPLVSTIALRVLKTAREQVLRIEPHLSSLAFLKFFLVCAVASFRVILLEYFHDVDAAIVDD